MTVKKVTLTFILICAVGLFIFLLVRPVPRDDKEKVSEIVLPARPSARPAAQIAIVIDDWGYSLENLSLLFEIEYPLTISILPNINYSTKVARAANRRKNLEIILHLPLEPNNISVRNLEPSTIYTSMPEEEIISLIRKALKSVPHSLGVSNHMGSKATQDRRFMKTIFSEIQKHELFFLDSLVIEDSICKELSREMNVRFAQRSVFLDNKNNAEYIKSQLVKLVSKSKSEGSAIGIGHTKETTLKVLKEMLPRLEEQGIQLVHLSQLVK